MRYQPAAADAEAGFQRCQPPRRRHFDFAGRRAGQKPPLSEPATTFIVAIAEYAGQLQPPMPAFRQITEQLQPLCLHATQMLKPAILAARVTIDGFRAIFIRQSEAEEIFQHFFPSPVEMLSFDGVAVIM